MKFVCDRCQTKYSIADDKVRGKVLKVRCKTCQNVITVREAGAKPSVGALAPVRTSQRPSSAALPTLGESHEESSDRTFVAPAPAGLMADLIAPQARRATPPPPPPVGDGIEWFLALDGAQQGPFSRRLLVDRLLTLPKDADVHVWNDKMDGWKPPKDVAEVALDLNARKPPAPPGLPPIPRTTPSPPLPPTSARRGTQPLTSGIGAKPVLPSNLPTPHVAAAHAVPAPHLAPAEAPGAATPRPLAARGTGPVFVPGTGRKSSASIPVSNPISKTNGVHAAAPAAQLPGGESDALSALNIDVGDMGSAAKAPAVAPRIMDVGEATAWSGAGRVQEGRHRNTKMIFAVLGVFCIVIVLVLNMNKKAPPVVAAAPVKSGYDSESLEKLHQLAAQEKNDNKNVAPPPTEAAHEEPAEPARGAKGAKGRGLARGRQVATRGGTSPAAAPAAPVAGAAQAPATSPAGTGFRERSVTPVSSVANRPPPSQAEITRVIANNKIGIKTCYQRALLRDSSLTHGKIVVGVTIGISGRVKGVHVDGPSSFRTLEPCIREMVGRWTFPQSSEEYGTEFSYLFQGNE